MSAFNPDLNALVCELSEALRARRAVTPAVDAAHEMRKEAERELGEAQLVYRSAHGRVENAKNALDRYLVAQ